MPKKIIITTIVMAVLTYLTGLLNYPYLCADLIVLTFYTSLISLFLIGLSLLAPKLKEDLSRNKKKLILVAFICLILFKLSAWAISKYYLPLVTTEVRTTVKAVVFIFTLIVAMNLATSRHKTLMICLSMLILLSVFAAPFVMPQKEDIAREEDVDSMRQRLLSLPYADLVSGEEGDTKTGVIIHDSTKAYKGINIWFALGTNKVHLMDMEGHSVHAWSLDTKAKTWQGDVVFCKNGDLLGATNGHLNRLDWESNVKWVNREFTYNHEIGVFENGDIFSLGNRAGVIFIAGLPLPTRDDNIVILTQEGKVKETTSLLALLQNNISTRMLFKIYWHLLQPGNVVELFKRQLPVVLGKKPTGFLTAPDGVFDNLHPNTITLMDRDVKGFCNKGDLLICVRDLDMIAIFDLKARKLTWQWNAGEASRPHHVTLLENNNLMFFDNGPLRDYSRVIEIDPITKELVWEYKSTPPDAFHSRVRSGAQRLPNGNTLITESDKGHAFEVTPEGETVWAFLSGQIDPEKEERPTIYRFLRITEPEKYPYLEKINSDIH